MPVESNKSVNCLGGAAGIKLMSVKDQATFWIRVENDQNLIPVERLDNFGNPIRKSTVIPAAKRKLDKLVLNGGHLSGRFSATGGPNESHMPIGNPPYAGHEASQLDPLPGSANTDSTTPGVEVILRQG